MPLGRLKLLGAAAILVASKQIGKSGLHLGSLCQRQGSRLSTDEDTLTAELVKVGATPEEHNFMDPDIFIYLISIQKEEMSLVNLLGWYLEINKPQDYLEKFLQNFQVEASLKSPEAVLKPEEVKKVRELGETMIDLAYHGTACFSFCPCVEL